jgi:Tol biopolymer transport system component
MLRSCVKGNMMTKSSGWLSSVSLGALALVMASVGLAPAGAAQAAVDWDVTNTGQPTKDVELTLTQGTWMGVDVSPDGKTIAFDLLNDIYTLPAEGGTATLVQGGPADQRIPSFSPDGQRLLYLSDADGVDNVWSSNLDGSDARQITHETNAILAGPAWTASGDGVIAAHTKVTFQQMYGSEMRLYDLAGGEGRVIVDAPANGRDVEEARMSPDGRYLYYSERITNPHIYVDANHMNFAIKRRDLQTGEVTQLIDGFGGAVDPAISADGKRLAFVRRVGAKTILFVYDIKSGEQRPVFDGLDRDDMADFVPQGHYYPHFDWFPDNRHVAIWAQGKIFKIDMDDGTRTEIPFTAHAKHRLTIPTMVKTELEPSEVKVRTMRQIAPSPDGKSIVVTALDHLWRKTGDAAPVRLTDAVANEQDPAFSRDGKELAYVEWDDEKGASLKVGPSSGKGAKVIATSTNMIRDPYFSPDGKTIAYRVQIGDKSLGGYRAKAGVYVVATKGGDSRLLAANGETPIISPDGKRVYYVLTDYDGIDNSASQRLESVTLDGLDKRVHAKTPDADTTDMRISPDLKWLAFRDRQQYYVMPYVETGATLSVSAADGEVPAAKLTDRGGYSLMWAGDSSKLYWTLGEEIFSADPNLYKTPDAGLPKAYTKLGLTLPADVPEGTLAFTHARLITMKGDQVIEDGTIVVERNKITALGGADVAIPAGAKIIDSTGKTIMPGLIEMHGHIDCCYGLGAVPQKQPTRYAAMAFGVTTTFDPYSNEQTTYESTEAQEAGVIVSPRWIGSGLVMYGRTRKADYTYVPIHTYADAQAAMARKTALGGIVIKSYKQPFRYQRQMLVKAAREQNIMVAVEGESHFYNNISMIEDGHTVLEHNLPLNNYYDDVVQLMAASGIHNTPVLNVVFGELFGENYMYQRTRSWDDPKVKTYVQETISSYSPLSVPGGAAPYVRGMTTIHVADELYNIGVLAVSRATKKLDDAGVGISVGSHGDFPGLGMHWEMQMLADGGMSNQRVLHAATMGGAEKLGFDHELGSLEIGKLADIIVLDKNPLEDIGNTNSVKYTMINGRLYDSMTMNEVGNYDRPRTKFYWETQDRHGIDWNESWTGQ